MDAEGGSRRRRLEHRVNHRGSFGPHQGSPHSSCAALAAGACCSLLSESSPRECRCAGTCSGQGDRRRSVRVRWSQPIESGDHRGVGLDSDFHGGALDNRGMRVQHVFELNRRDTDAPRVHHVVGPAKIEEDVMFWTPPNWMGLLLAAALFALVLAVAPLVNPSRANHIIPRSSGSLR